jgi:predicted outer membrane repeat protein
MRNGVKFLLILSISFLLTGSGRGGARESIEVKKFYVKPIEPSSDPSCRCPENVSLINPCETLDNYTMLLANLSDVILKNLNLSLIFLCGHHTLRNSSTDTTNVSGLHHLAVQGNGSDPSRVVVEGINLVINKVSSLYLENMTIKDVSFQVYPSSIDDPVPFTISNCHFNRSHSFIVGSNLTVQETFITNGVNTAFSLTKSTLTLKGNVTFSNNGGEKGGALGLTSSQLNISRGAIVTFANNHAISKGGAIYVNNPTEIFKVFPDNNCFYQLLDYSENASYSLTFTNNSACSGGKHIFGAPLKGYCTAAIDTESHEKVNSYTIVPKDFFHFDKPSLANNLIDSAVSGSPARVCICDEKGIPLCLNSTKIFLNVAHYPGELFTLPAILVGFDFGPTTGIVHSKLLTDNSEQQKTDAYLDTSSLSQLLDSNSCTNLNYTIFSATIGTKPAVMQLTAVKSKLVWNPNEKYRESINKSIDKYFNEGVIEGTLIFTPLFVSVTLKRCPPGFSLFKDSRCDCYRPLTAYKLKKDLQCLLSDSRGYMLLPEYWIGARSVDNKTEVILSRHFCPFCVSNDSNLWVDIQDEESISSQCAFNREDRLCGGCKEGYSLAIGSSSCVKCLNNNGLALLILFAVAGLLLVFCVIVLNFTVAQGIVNGVIFYANIVWIYEGVFFPQEHAHSLQFFRIFIAWLNLDFGIEMCFVKDLNAFWKSLLQYIFPLYICSIVAFIIWGARCSTRLTRLLGSKAVSVLSSLILLSYTKLLRNVYQSLNYASLDYYDNETRVRTTIVWAEDGRLKYVASEHAVVFFIGLTVAVLCLVYTLVLLFGQWLRRLSFFSRFHPIFDSYFAPIRSEHHYMLGMLLITRVFLYLLNILLAVHDVAIFILLVTTVLLLSYMAAVRPLRSKFGFLFYITFLVNLIILSGSVLFVSSMTVNNEAESMKIAYVTGVSTAVALLEFCALVVYRVIKNVRSFVRRMKYRSMKGDGKELTEDQCRYEQKTNSSSRSTCVTFRDAILSEDSLTSETSKPMDSY